MDLGLNSIYLVHEVAPRLSLLNPLRHSIHAGARAERHSCHLQVAAGHSFKNKNILPSTAGAVVYADLYGNYEEMRRKGDEEMETQGKIFVSWVEPEHYSHSVATVLEANGIGFDTIQLKDVVWVRHLNLPEMFPSYKFIDNHKAPLGYSVFDNFFKAKQAVQLSELLLIPKLNVAVVKARTEMRNNEEEWTEMIILLKEKSEWKVLGRIKSGS